MRVPFDSLCLCSALHEIQPWLGAKVQKVVQVDDQTLALQLYLRGAHWLWVSWNAETARLHLGVRPEQSIELSPFGLELRRRLIGARLDSADMREFDRIADLGFTHADDEFLMIAELMGKHANVMLTDAEGRLVAAAKWLGPGKSRRPVLPGKTYLSPPIALATSLHEALSPFARRAIEAGHLSLQSVENLWARGEAQPVVDRHGQPYPLPAGLEGERPVESFSDAASIWYQRTGLGQTLQRERRALLAPLRRLLQSRTHALSELRAASDAAKNAHEFQRKGEWILAFGFQAAPGSRAVTAWDEDGVMHTIPIDPEKTIPENAQFWFEKARRAKDGVGTVQDQITRLSEECEELQRWTSWIEAYDRLEDLANARAHALQKRWLQTATVSAAKEDRPYAGHRIRELHGPNDFKVLYGENSEANDYLTHRVAKSNDWWLHVRGNVSTHVVVQTHNQPDRVPMEVLRYAAEIAVRHSPLKHSHMVPVDYTLKKYVRRPRGSKPGFVVYTHEKTLHVDG